MGELDVLMHVPPSVQFSTWLSVFLYFIYFPIFISDTGYQWTPFHVLACWAESPSGSVFEMDGLTLN